MSFGTKGNAKLSADIATFSLPSGHTCPGAHACLTAAHPDTGIIKDGPHAQFRCFSAMSEAGRKNVRDSRWLNFTLLQLAKTRPKMRDLILESLPKNPIVRVHVGGDFFNQDYFDAWMDAAEATPDKRFYAYTKSLKLWVNRLVEIPFNFVLTASHGGKYDHLIEEFGLKSVQVVFHPEEAEALGLEVDHDDSRAFEGRENFALLLHGNQKKGSVAAAAQKRLKDEGIKFSYPAQKQPKEERIEFSCPA